MSQTFARLVARDLDTIRKTEPKPRNRAEAWALIRESIDYLWEGVKFHNISEVKTSATGQDAELLVKLSEIAARAERFAIDIEEVRGWHADVAAGVRARRVGARDLGRAKIQSGHEAYARLYFAQAELACAIHEGLVATAEVKLRELAALAQLAAEDLGLVEPDSAPLAMVGADG